MVFRIQNFVCMVAKKVPLLAGAFFILIKILFSSLLKDSPLCRHLHGYPQELRACMVFTEHIWVQSVPVMS